MHPSHHTPDFNDLVKDLKSVAGWQQLGPELARITPGRWDHLISWAARHGYRFTPTDIRHVVSQQRELLTKMAYRDANYTHRIQSQPSTYEI